MAVNISAPVSSLSPMKVAPLESCCAPIVEEPLAVEEAETLSAGFRVLSDPVRLRLLSLIANQGEVCICDLVEPVGRSQPTVSHHLSVLVDAGLIRREQRGKWAWVSLVPQRLEILRAALAIPESS